ncbi:DUF6502 family protein [Nitrosomonas sp. Is37]|uniref:DUF6502 family protein n=1 Tax=Nitrosomonas sp. Is37 TaxID=3080535 RepID=UPI00294B8C3D|nr:DUF6502 family protein [Nitrosomonas sp. Is37]MDV6344690.1 DUF6502 family protein [Nitrosomonas sp. Is37]
MLPSTSILSPALVSALRRVLRPFIKLMLAKGITYNYLSELLKDIFVEVAEKECKIGGKPSSDSHLSLLTGIHRKDIKRLRHSDHSTIQVIPHAVSMGARLVSLWTSDARYLDESNQPRPLPRFIKEGGDISFEGLVASVSCDIRSRVVLDEWLRLGVACFDEKNRVCLNTAAFVPVHGFDEKVYYFGHNLHDHAAAATSNLLQDGQPFLEHSVYYDALSADSVRVLAEKSESLGMESLLAINKEAIELKTNDALNNSPRYRMTFGIYYFSEPVEKKNNVHNMDE